MKILLWLILYWQIIPIFGNNNNNKQQQECIFIGCGCNKDVIKCPHRTNGDQLLTMFPKRRLLSASATAARLNLTIDLSRNQLEMVPDDRFANLDVYAINLSENRIIRVSPDAFRDIKRLHLVDLSSNQLKMLSLTLFAPVQASLHILKLNNNLLGDMETTRFTQVFTRLDQLTELDLSNNLLYNMPDLRQLTRLRKLNLASNGLETLVDIDTLDNTLPANLVELYLEKNYLKQISENWFDQLFHLKILNMHSNEISAIEENSFNHLTNLTSINLSRNNLKHIPSRIIYYLANLEWLDLSSQNARLSYLGDYAFDRETNKKPIKKILLNNNTITVVNSRAFCSRNRLKPFVNVKEIDLSDNGLRDLNACVLRQLAKGFSDPGQANKLRLFAKIIMNTNRDDVNRLMPCSCEITRSNKLVELEGFCRRYDGSSVYLRHYDCGEYGMSSSSLLNKFCSSRVEYECVVTNEDPSYWLTTGSSSTLSSSTAPSTFRPLVTNVNSTSNDSLSTLPIYYNGTGLFNYTANMSSWSLYFDLLNANGSTELNRTIIELLLGGNFDLLDQLILESKSKNNGELASSPAYSSSTPKAAESLRSSSSKLFFSKSDFFLCFLFSLLFIVFDHVIYLLFI